MTMLLIEIVEREIVANVLDVFGEVVRIRLNDIRTLRVGKESATVEFDNGSWYRLDPQGAHDLEEFRHSLTTMISQISDE